MTGHTMRYGYIKTWWCCTLSLAGLPSVAGADGQFDVLWITLGKDDVHCVVDGSQMACAIVAGYLKSELHVADDKDIVISIKGLDPTETRGRELANALKQAGFSRVMIIGFISEPDAPTALPATFEEAKVAEERQRSVVRVSQPFEPISQRNSLATATASCSPSESVDALLAHFEVILALGENGKVLRSYRQPDVDFTRCVTSQLTSMAWPSIGASPTFVSFVGNRGPSKPADEAILGVWTSDDSRVQPEATAQGQPQ